MIEVSVEEGAIYFAGAGSTPDGETGVFSTINFTPNTNFANGQTTVSLSSLRWNEGESLTDVASATIMSVVSIDEDTNIPSTFTLSQNFPNPFNPTTTISYGIPKDSYVQLYIYDVMGREVVVLNSSTQSAGWYNIQWNGLSQNGTFVGTGVYFAKIQAGEYSEVIKMVYLR